MDLNAVREQAMEATARALYDKHGAVPSEDSEEWEEEYRRQFEQVRKRLATAPAAAAKPAAAPAPGLTAEEAALPELSGDPTQLRWAAQLRADRLREIRDREVRRWLITTWKKAKGWIDTSTLPTPVFLQRIQPHFAEWRRREAERAEALAQERAAKEAVAAEIRRQIEAARITVEGLIELIDASERLPPAPIKDKLAELAANGRNLRVFETGDELVLTVLEKSEAGRSEYGIERDESIVADLRLYMRSLEVL